MDTEEFAEAHAKCGWCGAEPGSRCKTRTGEECRPHARRLARATYLIRVGKYDHV